MHFMEAISVLVPSKFTGGMVNRFMLKAPVWQGVIDVVLVGVDQTAWSNGSSDDGLDGNVLDIGHHLNDHFTTSL